MKVDISKKELGIVLYGVIISFGAYFCMYAFRKPFTVATYKGIVFWGIDYKIILILVQVLGYMLSKFIGIKLISELKFNRRIYYLISMILIAEMSLILFGLIPKPYNVIFMFINGLSLGMIWGVIFSYLEGRKFTEILGVTLCSSFIVSSGVVKSVGLLVMHKLGITEVWMPAVTGLIFLIPFVVFTLLLEKMPPPNEEDKLLKNERKPMDINERKRVFLRFAFPLIILVIFYISLTVLRDFRDNFSREIWDTLGFEGNISLYTLTEIPIAIIVLFFISFITVLENNYKAFISYHYLLVFGALFVGFSTILFQMQVISPIFWMINIGLGLYVCYVPFNCIFFDRMIATFRINGNAGFLIYIADAFGYLGSMGVLLYKNFGKGDMSWLNFFIGSIYVVSILGVVISIASMTYFKRKFRVEEGEIRQNIQLTQILE